MKTNKTVCIL